MNVSINPVRNAIVSVSNKTGLVELCQALQDKGVKLFSTGGTRDHLEKAGLKTERVEDLTRFPEMMDGRVKTLHPKVFGGILARRDVPQDLAEAAQHEIPLFDLVVVNLYPFWDHQNDNLETQTKYIDVGGPSMIRAAAKNSKSVAVLSDPADYAEFLAEWNAQSGTTRELRHRLAARTFARTSYYDAMIAQAWDQENEMPKSINLSAHQALRYGENPHQKAVWSGTPQWKVWQGKELSFNNLLDCEAAYSLANEFSDPAVVIVKHNNPCGVATGKQPVAALFEQAFQADSQSAFGGIVACNREIDGTTAEKLSPIFLEVIIARGFDSAAREILAKKKNLRLVEWPNPVKLPVDIRPALGGWLLQESDQKGLPAELKTVTQTQVTDAQLKDLQFAWLLVKHVKSNAIVLVKEGVSLGIGAGQMSRVDAVQVALQKCGNKPIKGAVLASDAFFPFRDNIDLIKSYGIAAIIQPGGSVRDQEVIDACNEFGIAMVFTGERHFRH